MKLKKCLSKFLLFTMLCSLFSTFLSVYQVHADDDITYENVEVAPLSESLPISQQYFTAYLDENGEVVVYTHEYEERNGGVLKIIIKVGEQILGYLYASVIDGIVTSITGHSGGYWVNQAINSVLGRPYRSTVTIPASGPFTCPGVVIDHSGMCR